MLKIGLCLVQGACKRDTRWDCTAESDPNGRGLTVDDSSTWMKYIRACEKAYLEKLIALCPDGVIAIDRSGRITLFNRTAETMTGVRAD